MYRLVWILPFKVRRKKLYNVDFVNIFDKYYFKRRAQLLFGPIYRIYEEIVSFDLYTDWNKLLALYEKRRELNVNINKIKNIIATSKATVKVYIASKWNVGTIILSFSVIDELTADELILLIRTFRRHHARKSLLSIKGYSTLTATEGLVKLLENIPKLQEIIDSSWDEVLENIYYFIMIDKSAKDKYSHQEILGIFARTLNYTNASRRDLNKLLREIIEMRKDELVYLGSYSGGAFIDVHDKATVNFYENLVLILVFIKYIIESLYIDAIYMLVSKKYAIKKLRVLLDSISNVKFLVIPHSLTDAYKFNNELLPLFMKNTKIYNLEKSLNEVVSVLENLMSKKYNERIQQFLLVLTILMIVLAIIQAIRMFLAL